MAFFGGPWPRKAPQCTAHRNTRAYKRSNIKKLKIAPGKFSIEVSSADKLIGVLETVMEAVRGGELDDALMKARGGKRERKVLQLRG